MGSGSDVYNVVVIGAGTAGLVTAAGTAGLGGRVALIERNQMGGDCLNFGCVPSKALISSARLVHHIRESERWGLHKQTPDFDFMNVLARMRERRARIAPNDSQERFESLGVKVLRGEARFVSPCEVSVNGESLRARNFVIATGSRATVPDIPGLRDVTYFTNETLFDKLRSKPDRLLVIGGGPIGCELGQAFQRLGVQVILAQKGPHLLPVEDDEIGHFLEERLTGEGVDVRLNARIQRVRPNGSAIIASFGDDHDTEVDAILIAAGRTPNLRALNLEAARVKYSDRGIEVNDYMQTSQPHIYAAGDIANRLKFTHTADYTARVVVRNILMPVSFLRQKVNCSIVPWCTYTDPEIARVGINESEAKRKQQEYELFTLRLEEVDRAVVESETQGFAKVLTEKGSDKILGATLVAAHAGDLIHEFVVAMNANVGLGRIGNFIHAYPTFAELARKLGDKYNKTRLTPRAKRIFTWLYKRARR